MLGVKLAEICSSTNELCSKLESQLPQNSPVTRRTYARRVCAWLFPDGSLDSAPLAAWLAYRDEQILLDHFRVRYLEAIPLLGKFVTDDLAILDTGSPVRPESVRAFVSRECGVALSHTVTRLPVNLGKLGFISRAAKEYVRATPAYDPTSVALELLRIFGQAPTTTSFAEIAAHPFWRYIGVPDSSTLENVLYTAVAHGLLAKFVKSDELNQVTNGYSYREVLSLALRIPK